MTPTLLRQAEKRLRQVATDPIICNIGTDILEALTAVLAEYDRRGTELASLQERNTRLGLVRLDAEQRHEQTVSRVLGIHQAEVWGDDTLNGTRTVCSWCRDSSEEAMAWPCPTAIAVGVTT